MHYFLKTFFTVSLTLFLISCSTKPYDLGRSRSGQLGDATIRYGSIAGAGAGGYLVGDSIGGGDPMISGVGAAAGAGLAYGLHKYNDGKRMEAYNMGRNVGAQEAREALLVEKWKREAIYGLPPEGQETSVQSSKYRNVYVPSRTINGVKMEAGYQQVQIP